MAIIVHEQDREGIRALIKEKKEQLASLEEVLDHLDNGPRCAECGVPESDHHPKRVSSHKFQRDLASEFVGQFNRLTSEVHENARDKGWWESDRSNGELIALCHSELSEMLEALRHGNPKDDKVTSMDSAVVEAADVVIRLMDLCGARNWDLGRAIVAKVAFNKTRSYKHGGKKF